MGVTEVNIYIWGILYKRKLAWLPLPFTDLLDRLTDAPMLSLVSMYSYLFIFYISLKHSKNDRKYIINDKLCSSCFWLYKTYFPRSPADDVLVNWQSMWPADMFCLINLMRYFSWLINIDMYYIVAVVPPPSYNNILLLDCCGDQPFCATIFCNFCFFGNVLY